MKRVLSCYLIIMVLLAPAVVRAVESLGIAVNETQVYVYWGQLKDSAGTYELQRAKGNGKFQRLFQVRRISDVDEANRVLRSAPDALSRALTLDAEFEQHAMDNPGVDQGMALASVGYAVVRGYGYIDTDVSRRSQYKYRLVQVGGNGTVNVFATGDADTARPTHPLAVSVSARIEGDHPVLSWQSAPYVRYHVQRADKSDGPYTRLTLMPLPSMTADQSMRYDDSNVRPDGRNYYYQVVAYSMLNQPGAVAQSVAIVTPDRTPPVPPAELDAENRPAAVMLRWNAGAETDIAGYTLYRGEVNHQQVEQAVEWTRLTKDLLTSTTVMFEDTALVPGHVYQYAISAVDSSGNESKHSLPVLGMPRDVVPPGLPSGLNAKVSENGKVLLSWKANTDADLYAYRIYRAADDSELNFVREIPVSELHNPASPTRTEQLDTHSESEYRYAITAVDATENESPLSGTVKIRLPDIVPPLQPVLTELKAKNGAIVLSWAPSPSADVASYNVYRGEADGKLSRINNGPLAANELNYRDNAVNGGVVYRYAVSAVDRSGNEGEQSDMQSSVTYVSIDPVAPSSLSLDKTGKPWRLQWQASAKASAFIAYLASARDGDYHQVGAMLVNRSLEIPVPSVATVWYRIQAVFPRGVVSALSEPIAAVPPTKDKQR